MNANTAHKYAIRHAIQFEGMANGHAAHDEQLCSYADAAAAEMYEQVVKELPAMIETVVTRYLKDNPYALEVDKASLANVKTQITNLFKNIFR